MDLFGPSDHPFAKAIAVAAKITTELSKPIRKIAFVKYVGGIVKNVFANVFGFLQNLDTHKFCSIVAIEI